MRRWLAAALILVLLAAPAMASWYDVADYLAAEQTTGGSTPPAGSWPGEDFATGAIVAGMVRAYEVTGTPAYKTCAEAGGNWIHTVAYNSGTGHYNYFGDEAYALTRLSDISDSQDWLGYIADFYQDIHDTYPGGTPDYIDMLEGWIGEPSQTSLYVGHHAVAADTAAAVDADIWRDSVIGLLGDVTDSAAAWPVMGLGVSVWALALTGGEGYDMEADTTEIQPGVMSGTWYNSAELRPVQVGDLPSILQSHQHPSGGFYWRFDHAPPPGDNPAYGYTEDTVFGTLGLQAANEVTATDYSQDVYAGFVWTSTCMDTPGPVLEHPLDGTVERYYFGGEALRLMVPEPTTVGLLVLGCVGLWRRRKRRQA